MDRWTGLGQGRGHCIGFGATLKHKGEGDFVLGKKFNIVVVFHIICQKKVELAPVTGGNTAASRALVVSVRGQRLEFILVWQIIEDRKV